VNTSDFDYRLPQDRIAQRPVEPRDAARLMVLDRASRRVEHRVFSDLPELLRAGDILVVNDTRVFPARLKVVKQRSGGQAEVLLLRPTDSCTWEALVGGKGLRPGVRLVCRDGLGLEISEDLGGARRRLVFDEAVEPHLPAIGQVPVPPYIRSAPDDPNDYQTIYARTTGSAAAPTAGMHFTESLLTRLQHAGIGIATVTLHIGLDTFAPVEEAQAEDHLIHSEWCQVTPEAVAGIEHARSEGGRVVAVGTTAVRVLESAASRAPAGQDLAAFEGTTDLFILPGHTFRAVDALITNFHLPRSTLLMLVSAFAGREPILAAYQDAIEGGYRFYSYGDAMLIV
jgi:S-adenosylmethionine:tRNA ribosyltransferase-isomerase